MNKLIETYEVKNNMIILYLKDNSTHIMPYSINTEEHILNIMKHQTKIIKQFEKENLNLFTSISIGSISSIILVTFLILYSFSIVGSITNGIVFLMMSLSTGISFIKYSNAKTKIDYLLKEEEVDQLLINIHSTNEHVTENVKINNHELIARLEEIKKELEKIRFKNEFNEEMMYQLVKKKR